MLDIDKLLLYLTRICVILLVLPLHEFAHAWMAKKLGDDTAEYQGRLTLNPLAHLDPIGGLCLLLTGFGWAKPVPVNPNRFNRKFSIRGGMALTAAAGPISNLIAAFVGMVVMRIYTATDYYLNYLTESFDAEVYGMDPPLLISSFLAYFVSINVGLAVFNLIPIPPLDGSKVLFYFLGNKGGALAQWLARNEMVVRIVFFALLYSPILRVPLNMLNGLIMNGMYWITNWIPMLMLG